MNANYIWGVKMLNLAIHHNIWLSRDQRYALHDGTDVTVVGISIPVWVSENKHTSEPAKEIFCKYYLKNPKYDHAIQILNDGYEITLPNRSGTLPALTDDEWMILNHYKPEKLDELYNRCIKQVNSQNLLDIVDGGSKYLSFREHNKVKRPEGLVNFIHFVNMMDVESLYETMI